MAVALAALAGTTACASLAPTSVRMRGASGPPTTASGVPGAGPARPDRPGADSGVAPGVGGRLADPASNTAYAGERRVCRAGGVPRGWVAVAYVNAPDECPARPGRRGADSAAAVAVVVRYAAWSRGSVLEVCADQPVPGNWFIDAEQSLADPGRCPGAARTDAPTTKRIRRGR